MQSTAPSATSTAFAPEGEATSLRDRIREFLTVSGLERTNSWIQRVSRDYARLAIPGTSVDVFIATRIALSDVERRRLAERADMRYLLSYADPTGETAVRNVMRDQSDGSD